MPVKLSICIPTYNRAQHLANCLQSIISNPPDGLEIQVCVSDNCSGDETERVVRVAQKEIAIKYLRNTRNIGLAGNFLKAVEMADGEFVWLIGDDDLLLPGAVARALDLIGKNPDVDYFFANSFHLSVEHVLSFPHPFNTANLPKTMVPFSSWPTSGKMMFLDLIDPKISFDFLGGIYLSIFRRKMWIANANVVSEAALADTRVFSNFDNTFPQIKILAKAFARSKAWFCAEPLSVCLTGVREWAPLYRMVRSVRLVEALDEYRKNGLPLFQYIRCKNFALRTFLPDLMYMVAHHRHSGISYINAVKEVLNNMMYPNFYLSVGHALRRLPGLIARST